MKTLELTRGQYAIVDDEDFERVARLKWRAMGGVNGRYYAYTTIRETGTQEDHGLARFILGVPKGINIRYRDGNPLNCCRSNLYVVEGFEAPGEVQQLGFIGASS